jgi:Fe2+ or Zn2+ uptake regulation protein
MNPEGADQIRHAFHDAGLRCTPQRYVMLQYLMTEPMHPTADQIFHAVNGSDPRSSRATIYNNLHALAKAGMVSPVAVDAGPVRYEANRQPHHHFICERCGRLEDIEAREVAYRPRRVQLGGRLIQDFQIVFRGICEKCSQKTSLRAPVAL